MGYIYNELRRVLEYNMVRWLAGVMNRHRRVTLEFTHARRTVKTVITTRVWIRWQGRMWHYATMVTRCMRVGT